MDFSRLGSIWRFGRLAIVAVVLGSVLHPARAQDTTRVVRDIGWHRDTIDTFQPQPYELDPNILPGTETIRVGRTRLDSSEYRLDPRPGRLWIERRDLLGARDTIFASYRTYPFALEPVYRRRAVDSVGADSGVVAIVRERSSATSGFDPFEGIDIERSGSIRRGFVGGTARDVTPESGLRMQLQGEVADSVFVRALITDENTPIQPEGTTQRLQDFDRVYLGVDAPEGTARLGDVDVELDGGRFGQFSQKVQGAVLSSDGLGRSVGLAGGETTLFGAVSRGQYRKQDIEPLDGVQGPYRLRGKNGEDAIIVIAGSERVYLDGEQLTRGRTEDYVIDYTRAEITFTAAELITDDRRLTVEFQYSTSRFTRTLAGGHATARVWAGDDGDSRLQLGATVVRQADRRDFLTAFDLSPQDSLRLVQSGDERAVRSGARLVQYDPEAPFVHYRKEAIQTGAGAPDTIFVAVESAPSEGVSVYRVRFTRVGVGEGAYERAGRKVNGVVYEFVGEGDGAYEPVQPLPAPTRQRLVDLTGSIEPISGLTVSGEWANSLNDENRFSGLDAADDGGRAFSIGAELDPIEADLGGVDLGTISGSVERRRRGDHFETFDQTRPIEYGRKWNLSQRGSVLPSQLRDRGAETIDEGTVHVDWTEASGLDAGVGRLEVGRAFEAWRQTGSLSIREEGWPRLSLRSVHVESEDRIDGIEGSWVRQEGGVRQPLLGGALEPSMEVERERRQQRAAGTDSLVGRSFQFVELRPGLSYRRGPLRATGSIEYRTEDGIAEGAFREASQAWTARSEIAFTPSGPYRASIEGGYRSRDVTDSSRRNEQRIGTESVILQVEGRAEPVDRAISARIFYDAATERTPILRELYVQTRPELGQYVWRDHNDDGVQQIDEFIPETTPNEGTYVRRFVPSDTLDSVVDLQARTRLSLRPRRLWRRSEVWWKNWLSRVTTQTSVDVQEKSRTASPAEIYQLDLSRFRRAGRTVDGSLQLEQQIELFRSERQYGLDLTWRQVRGLTERAAGAERRFLNRWEVGGTLRPASNLGIGLEGSVGRDRVQSEAFAETRSYDIRSRRVRPRVSFEPSRQLEITLAGVYAQKRDRTGGRDARLLRLPVEITWSRAGRLRLTANAEVADVDLKGSALGRAQFELTEGRGPGRSVLWGIRGQYAVSRHLNATLNYDGRAPATAPVIHTLRVQMSASF